MTDHNLGMTYLRDSYKYDQRRGLDCTHIALQLANPLGAQQDVRGQVVGQLYKSQRWKLRPELAPGIQVRIRAESRSTQSRSRARPLNAISRPLSEISDVQDVSHFHAETSCHNMTSRTTQCQRWIGLNTGKQCQTRHALCARNDSPTRLTR